MKYYVNAYDDNPKLITQVTAFEGEFIYAFVGRNGVECITSKGPKPYWIRCAQDNFKQVWRYKHQEIRMNKQ